MTWGQLTLDGTETLYALDGQHRLKSIQLAIRQRPELAREQIPVIFIPHRSPRRSQLLFSDLNRFAKSPSKSISLLFSHRDPVVTLAKVLMDRVDFLAGRVEVETTSLSKHTPNVVTLSSLYEMTRSLTEGRTVGDPLAQEEVDRQIEIWYSLVRHVEPWRKVAAREEHPAYLRKEYLAMHGVCHQAIAGAIAPLLTNGADIDTTLERLGDCRLADLNQEWQGIAVQGRHISNTSTTVRNLAGMLSFKVGGQVETGVAQSLVAIIRGRGANHRPISLRSPRATRDPCEPGRRTTDAPRRPPQWFAPDDPLLRVIIPCSKRRSRQSRRLPKLNSTRGGLNTEARLCRPGPRSPRPVHGRAFRRAADHCRSVRCTTTRPPRGTPHRISRLRDRCCRRTNGAVRRGHGHECGSQWVTRGRALGMPAAGEDTDGIL